MRAAFVLAFGFLGEIEDEEDQTTTPTEAAQATGSYAKHADAATLGSHQMDQSTLAL